MDGAFVLYVNHPNNKATIHAQFAENLLIEGVTKH
jgi:hypothetical protein